MKVRPVQWACLSLVCFGCSNGPRPAQTPRAFFETHPAGPATPLPTTDETTQSNVMIADDIRKACGLNEADAFFAYDSANVRAEDKTILTKLAECFTKGPLNGREIRLVGHADPRGDEEYNYLLGQRRADTVQGALTESGMPLAKVSTTSQGDNQAAGNDDAGWAKDRRVDVLLGN